jgi:hypothetical protein
MNPRPVIAFVAAALSGAAIWAASPHVIRQVEPWDGSPLYYVVALFFGGVVSAIAGGRHNKGKWLLWPVGLVLGQLVFMYATIPPSPLLVVGIVFLTVFSIPAIIGSGLISYWFQRDRCDRGSNPAEEG